jgi:hypothetical protein
MIKTVERSCAGEVVVVMHVGGQVIIEDWVGSFWYTQSKVSLYLGRFTQDRRGHLRRIPGSGDWKCDCRYPMG